MNTSDITALWGRVDDACHLVRRYHYSGRPPALAAIRCVLTWHLPGGLLGDTGPAIAACFFSTPANKWGEDVWELSRLVRHPDYACAPLTGIIGCCCSLIRRSKKIDLLVSYADSEQGHHGGVYQAASWNYTGKRGRAMVGIVVAGERIHGRSAVHRFKTRSPAKLKAMGIDAEPWYDEGKHLYWRALSKQGEAKAQRLGLLRLTYPKPTKMTAPSADAASDAIGTQT